MNFFEKLTKALRSENLLGSPGVMGKNFEGSEWRLGRDEALAIQAATRSQLMGVVSPETISQYLNRMKEILIGLASGDLTGKAVGAAYTTASAIKFTEPMFQDPSQEWIGQEQLFTMSYLIQNWGYAIAFLEKNLPPNDLGYIADQCMSLVRTDEIVCDRMVQTFAFIEAECGELSKILGQNPKALYNAVRERIETNRPTFMERRVRPNHNIPMFVDDDLQISKH